MIPLHPQYIVDETHAKKSVVLTLGEWAQVLEALEELDEIHSYDAAMAEPDEAIPFDQAVREIREKYDA